MDTEKKYVTYEEFGALGDGKTDDMPAIVAAHAYANEHGLDIAARDDANYYIGGKNITAVIKTNVYWGKAHFTLDDRVLEDIRQSCFIVAGEGKVFTPDISSLKKEQKTVDFEHEGEVLVRVTDNSHTVYIRKGLNRSNGLPASDSFVVDADGNVIGDINWDYENITTVTAVPVNDSPITIEGGIFTTIANEQPSFYNYHARNIKINRSHVTVKGITYLVTGEGDHGAPYTGFLTVSGCYDVTLENCLLTPHFTYMTESKEPGKLVSMGSYSINIDSAIGVRLINIRQTIDITDRRYWGLMGSNFSKNFYMENCEISRYDAHMGVTNCMIKNCKLGHMGTNLIGFGECTIENTTFACSRTVTLRPDYGSSFRGRLVMRNCVWIPTSKGSSACLEIIKASNSGDHNFGYPCSMPYEIVIDGLTIDDAHIDAPELYYSILPNYDSEYAKENPYPYETTHKLTLRGISSLAGRNIMVCREQSLYPHLSVTTED